jgi:sarcosine oxidase subunit beta
MTVPYHSHSTHSGRDRTRPLSFGSMRIVVCGAGATGASVAYHLALAGAGKVVLCDRGTVAGGATGKAFGGVRQQFSTAAEVRLAQASVRFFEELGEPLFLQVGYLFLATTEEGLAELEERRQLQEELGVPVEAVSAGRVVELAPGVAVDDVLGGVLGSADGLSDPPSVCRELVRRAVELGVELREHTDGRELEGDVRVIACGPWSAEVAASHDVELPVRPLRRQLILTGPVAGLPERLPLVIEAETGFHFRRRDDRLLLAMVDPDPRWGSEETIDETLLPDRMARLSRRYPPAAAVALERAWAGLYDMTPDAHPIIDVVGEGIVAACGFSGHGFMQSPAVGRAVTELVLGLEPSFDLSPYRLSRFEQGAVFPEQVVL